MHTIRIEPHVGPRDSLRPLFELAEDSALQLGSYIDEGEVIVAVSGDEIVGHLQLTENGGADEIEIKNMAVLESHQGRGVGSGLIAAAIERAREGSFSTLCVATATADIDNLRFYQRRGFRMRLIERDAFTAATGYDPGLMVDGIGLRDRVWLDLPLFTDADLYSRGCATLLASWDEYARGARGAKLHRLPGVAAAVFSNEPERSVYNNALLDRALTAPERMVALEAMESAYAEAGVTRFAAWVHESDEAVCAELERRGYRLDTTTRAMGMALSELRLPRPAIELAPPDWREYLRIVGVPPDFLSGADPAAYHILIARLDGENVAAGMAFDLDGDCGIYNVGTLEHARRRGLGTSLTALLAHDALVRGCQTASLQSTEMAERVYANVGFRDLGRILEYVP